MLRKGVRVIEAGEEERSTQELLKLSPPDPKPSFVMPPAFDARAAANRVILVALATLRPRHLVTGEPLDVAITVEREQADAFRAIVGRRGLSASKTAANRIIHPAEAAIRQRLNERAGQVRTHDEVLASHAIGRASAAALSQEMTVLIPALERLLVHGWRRQLAAALERGLGDAEAAGEVETGHLTVGFADQVGFTRLTRRMEEPELAALVERFESRSADIVVGAGGRLIKTLGDEILFVASDPVAAAEASLRLITEHQADETIPRVRIGLATGVVVTRRGDVFGTTVNLASRLTAVARPDSVLVDGVTADALAEAAAYRLRPLGPGAVRGIGLVRPVVLERR